ncbi:hypothetical protein Dimus_032104 [Dionaea muscipula]
MDVVKEFYAKMTVIHLKKKDIVKSKEVWEESKYTKPLEITRRFANDASIMAARRVKSGELKPFQRFVHFLEKDKSPRVMIRHMSYVISMKDHELPYGDWLTMVFEAFGIPLVDKKGEEPKRYDFFEDTFLTMCKLTRENGVWWIGSGENRRRDEEVEAPEEEAEDVNERNQDDFDWEAVIDEATVEGESGSDDQFYDAQVEKDKGIAGVDPSGPTGKEAEFLKFQAEFERKRANQFHDDLEKAKAENAGLLALLHQAKFKSNP